MFRHFVSIFFALMLFVPAVAHADFIYKVDDHMLGSSFSFVEPTLNTSGFVASSDFFDVTGPTKTFPGYTLAETTLAGFVWNSNKGGWCMLPTGGGASHPSWACASSYYTLSKYPGSGMGLGLFDPGSFLAPGTYDSMTFDSLPVYLTVTITDTSTIIPESSSLILLGTGVLGLIGRKLFR